MLRQLLALVRQMPSLVEAAIVARLDRVYLAWHRPEPISLGEPWCLRCKEPWPCAELGRRVKALERQR